MQEYKKAKGEDLIKENTDQTCAFVDEFLEKAIKRSSLHETDEDVDYEYWSSNHNAHARLSISNCLHNKGMNILHLSEKYHISILDGDADTCVLGQGWEALSVHNTRRANVVGFDHEAGVKRYLPIVSDFGVKIDSICHKHGGTQKMVIQDVGSSLVVPLKLAGCRIHFKRRRSYTGVRNILLGYSTDCGSN
jgi:hypothetical protein